MPWLICRGQRIACWGQFSPFIKWTLGTEHRSPGQAARTSTHRATLLLLILPTPALVHFSPLSSQCADAVFTSPCLPQPPGIRLFSVGCSYSSHPNIPGSAPRSPSLSSVCTLLASPSQPCTSHITCENYRPLQARPHPQSAPTCSEITVEN